MTLTRDGAPRLKGRLFIVSAPSGAGKTTLCRAIRERFPDIRYSVSHTTRPPRPLEVDGKDYHFISREEFLRGIETGKWAEWAIVHGNHYGTSEEALRRTIDAGHDVLMDIDVQGASQLTEKFPDSVTFFITAPSLSELRARLTARGADPPEVIHRRIENARMEIAHKDRYRHIIVNDDVNRAAAEFIAIVGRYRKNQAA